jgi:phosphatidylinositol alpha 1,6-mannosyltransferase
MSRVPRVAFLPDSFHEVNGVAHTARQFTAWAAHTGKPFLCIRAALTGQHGHPAATAAATPTGSVQVLELPRGFASFPLDKDLRYDPLFWRHAPAILGALRSFQPDVIHITGPSELGMLGAALAHHLGVPLAASWHTNVHEYAARRSAWALRAVPRTRRPAAAAAIEHTALQASALFYKSAKVLFAPNPALCELLTAQTGRPCFLMTRGIDAELFCPTHRDRPAYTTAQPAILGYVGRLSIEKNVALLPQLAATLNPRLQARGLPNVQFLIVGQGAQQASLRATLPAATFAGVLRGPALARAYANMDCFVFPSHTDTFGNVVLEALASGVPAVVTPDGGPAHIVCSSNGAGIVAHDGQFADAIADILTNPARQACMRQKARAYAQSASWDAVFADVYKAYTQVGLFRV